MEKTEYLCIFSKGGIVRYEAGEAPPYMSQLISRMKVQNAPNTIRVRDDVITYTMDMCNVYLAMYKDIRWEGDVLGRIACIAEEADRTARTGAQPNWKEVAGGARPPESEQEAAEPGPQEGEAGPEPESEPESEEESQKVKELQSRPSLFSFFRQELDLEKIEEQLRAHLFAKNVPAELSSRLAKEISMRAKNDPEPGSLEEKLKRNTARAIEQMMPTRDPMSIVSEILALKESKKTPYVFCMVGVNGVGKSTTLSKLCLWLLKNNLSLCVAACDSFRSGAVEQLRKYVARYQSRKYAVELYEKGYGKDESSIARGAIEHARERGYDVVLIDTSGRMHGNRDLMRSLSKLVRVSRPHQVIYVGEALVGNDSMVQIKTFNEHVEKAGVDKALDGIIVTKCDAVDDKVGAILSLSCSVNKPVLFIGVGQSNVDLLPFSLDNLCRLLS